MFGVSQQEAVNALGTPDEDAELPMSDRRASVGEVADSAFSDRYSTGDFGRESLIEQTLTQRNQQLHAMGLLDDPVVHATRPQYADSIEGKPNDDVTSAVYWREVEAQKAQEDKIAQIYKNNPQLPQITYRSAVDEAHAQADSLDMQSESVARHAGVLTKVAGNIAGGGAATFTPENQLQMATMALPVPGSTWWARTGSMALQQFGVSLSTQAAVVNPSRQATGLSTLSGKQLLEQALVSGTTGALTQGAFEGAHAGYVHYFPPTTATTAKTVADKMDNFAATESNPVGMKTLVVELKKAETPDEAATAMAGAPLETQLDVVHAVNENPSAGEKAILLSGEQELMAEKSQPEGVSWSDHMQRRDEVAASIETDTPTPEPRGAIATVQVRSESPAAPSLPQGLTNAKPRYRDATTSFESDIDKALFITSQAKKSKADAAYRQFLKDHGFDDNDIEAGGQRVRDALKAAYSGEGNIHLAEQTHPVEKPVQPVKSPADVLRGKTKAPKSETLLDFIAKEGGIKDEGGDLKSIGADQYHRDKSGKTIPFKRKLINNEGGLSADEMALKAHEAGYFDELGGERPTINHLLDKIDEGLRGNHTHPHYDPGVSEYNNMLSKMEEEMDRAGVSPNTHSDAEIQAALERQRDEFAARQAERPPEPINIADQEFAETARKLLEAGPDELAPLSDEGAMTIKDALAEIDDHQGLLESLTTCFRS